MSCANQSNQYMGNPHVIIDIFSDLLSWYSVHKRLITFFYLKLYCLRIATNESLLTKTNDAITVTKLNIFLASANTLKVLLSFAVGGLLGDVFLHLLPEAWANDVKNGTNGHPSLYSGMLVLLGIIVFVAAEKLFSGLGHIENEIQESKDIKINNNSTKDIHISKVNGHVQQVNGYTPVKPAKTKRVAGYLNLLANSIDNFTHGLAVGGSFLISLRLGALTTFAILIHEIPHEVGDFAILLKSGFSRWDAAWGQILTASAGLLGSLFAVACSGTNNEMESRTSWILPFTAGGFLHIGLVSVLPELLQEDSPKESVKQLGALLLGIVVMAGLTMLE